MSCLTHGRGFTLYPPGYAPYQRRPVLHVAPDGAGILEPKEGGEDAEADEACRSLEHDFGATLFQAALDAAEGTPWSRDSHDSLPEAW